MQLRTFVLIGKKQLVCLRHHYVVAEKVSQIIASIKTKIHITELASGLTSSIDQFKPDGPFFIRIAVLVRDSIQDFCHTSTSSRYSDPSARGRTVTPTGLGLPKNLKKSGTARTRNSEHCFNSTFAMHTNMGYRILVEYLLDDQGTYPRRDADTAPVNADFTSTRSDNSIVQAAGQLMGSRV